MINCFIIKQIFVDFLTTKNALYSHKHYVLIDFLSYNGYTDNYVTKNNKSGVYQQFLICVINGIYIGLLYYTFIQL